MFLKKKQNGLSLVELLVIILIIGIFSNFLINNILLSNVRDIREKAHQQTLIDIIKYSPYIGNTVSASNNANNINSTLTLSEYNTIATAVDGGF